MRPDVGPVGGHLEEPGASDGELSVLPGDLLHARLLNHVPKPQRLLLMTPLTVHQSEQKKPRNVKLSRHMIGLKSATAPLLLLLLN